MKPMLSGKAEDGKIKFPVLASPKIDGVRALVLGGVLVSRSLKPIRNEYVQAMLAHPGNNGFDGELVVGSETDPNCMQNTTSGVMATDGTPDFTYWVFDDFCWNAGFSMRLASAKARVATHSPSARIRIVPHTLIYSQADLDAYEAAQLELGFEGIMIRDPDGPYKQGRSTAKEGWLLKVKRFTDSEALVIGVEEEMHNANEAKKDALGHTERSTSKAGLVGKNRLGALRCRTPEGVEFSIGSGFSAMQRETFWYMGANQARNSLIGRIAKYKHFAAVGVKEAPRFPVFVGFRAPEDMS